MLTYWTKTLIPTSRNAPSDAIAPSHNLMLRAGIIHQLGAGIYDYLPLGTRILHKVMAVIRSEMDNAGGVEVFMPTLQPIELWEQTGRRTAYGENLFVVKDRHGREQALGPTHEEVFTEMVKAYIESYRQLPITLYQIQTKFRDEFRPRFGVLRSREFQMKDAYSFDLDMEGLDRSYQAMYDAYCRIFKACGVPYRIVEAESGPIGGNASHEFMIPSPTGEDTILESDKGNYAANVEKCEIGQRPISETFAPFSRSACTEFVPAAEPTGELEKVHTPGMATIEDVGKFMKVKPKNMLKTLVYQAIPTDTGVKITAENGGTAGCFIAVVRGDHDVNDGKLAEAIKKTLPTQGWHAELIDLDVAKTCNFPIGFVGPHLIVENQHVNHLFIDADVAQSSFWASGANEVDQHVKHFNWKRDVIDPLGDGATDRVTVADIRNAVAGDPSPKNDGGVLRETKGIEVGHVFKLGCKYSDAMDLKVLDDKNERSSVIMGCYGIGVNRIIAGAIERDGGNDENGIVWPASIAPYHIVITPIKYEGEVKQVVDKLAKELTTPGVPASAGMLPGSPQLDILIDDRDERPGVKFKDADLIGIPVRITVGDKGLKDGNVEVKARTADKAENIKVEAVVEHVRELLKSL